MKFVEISEGPQYILDQSFGTAEKAQLLLQNHVC